MRTVTRCFLPAALLVAIALPVHAEERGPNVILEEARAHKLLQKYRTGFDKVVNSEVPMGEDINPIVKKLNMDCGRGAEKCKMGWDAVRGKFDPKVGDFLKDMLDISMWGGKRKCEKSGTPQYLCGPSGDAWSFTVLGPGYKQWSQSIRAGIYALALYKTPGAAEAIAKTLATEKHFQNLWDGNHKPLNALFYLSAKEQLPTILKSLKYTDPAGGREHLHHALNGLAGWSLTPEQVDEAVKTCAELFEDTNTKRAQLAACTRFAGMVGSTNEDARAFIANWANGSGDGWLRIFAIRAAAGMKLKDTKAALQGNLQKAYRQKVERIRKGRKVKEVKTDTWNHNFHAVESAIVLFGMKDKKAKKAIEYWTSLEERHGKLRLKWSNGFENLARDAAFADPKTRKALGKIMSKNFKKLVKDSKTNNSNDRSLFKIALGLSYLGDKDAVKYLMEFIEGRKGGASDIESIFEAWGAYPRKLLAAGNSPIGIGRLPIGDTMSSKDAAAIAKVLEKKLRFWGENLKQSGTLMLMRLRAQMHVADNKL